MMGRGGPRKADCCNERREVAGQVWICGRALGHQGDHGQGRIRWPRRVAPPSATSAAAIAPEQT